ncbi:hypothetical protein JW930_01465 [Candidatus Woesearchaeota archaeon]|nr:hypothetical protein [Candidatus Woesearchaeota archaeon]
MSSAHDPKTQIFKEEVLPVIGPITDLQQRRLTLVELIHGLYVNTDNVFRHSMHENQLNALVYLAYGLANYEVGGSTENSSFERDAWWLFYTYLTYSTLELMRGHLQEIQSMGRTRLDLLRPPSPEEIGEPYRMPIDYFAALSKPIRIDTMGVFDTWRYLFDTSKVKKEHRTGYIRLLETYPSPIISRLKKMDNTEQKEHILRPYNLSRLVLHSVEGKNVPEMLRALDALAAGGIRDKKTGRQSQLAKYTLLDFIAWCSTNFGWDPEQWKRRESRSPVSVQQLISQAKARYGGTVQIPMLIENPRFETTVGPVRIETELKRDPQKWVITKYFDDGMLRNLLGAFVFAYGMLEDVLHPDPGEDIPVDDCSMYYGVITEPRMYGWKLNESHSNRANPIYNRLWRQIDRNSKWTVFTGYHLMKMQSARAQSAVAQVQRPRRDHFGDRVDFSGLWEARANKYALLMNRNFPAYCDSQGTTRQPEKRSLIQWLQGLFRKPQAEARPSLLQPEWELDKILQQWADTFVAMMKAMNKPNRYDMWRQPSMPFSLYVVEEGKLRQRDFTFRIGEYARDGCYLSGQHIGDAQALLRAVPVALAYDFVGRWVNGDSLPFYQELGSYDPKGRGIDRYTRSQEFPLTWPNINIRELRRTLFGEGRERLRQRFTTHNPKVTIQFNPYKSGGS